MALYAPPTGIGQVIHFLLAAVSHSMRYMKTLFFLFLLMWWPTSVIAQVPCSGGTVALTIDDGPGPDTTGILQALANANLKATFFMIGSYVQQFPALAQQVVAGGHEVENHSWSHPVMTELTQAEIDFEIQKANDQIFATTGRHPKYFRPPYGQSNQMVWDSAVAHGLTNVTWTIDTEDYTGISPDAIANQMTLVQPSGVVLLHNWAQNTKVALGNIGWYMQTYRAATPICYGRLGNTTNVMPTHDWVGEFSFVHAVQW